MPSILDLNSSSFQSQIKNCSFSDTILRADSSLDTIVKILSSFERGIPLCLVPKDLPQLPSISPEGAAFFFMTSGTTGKPKIVKLTKTSLLHAALHGHPDFGLGPDSRYALTLPLHHIAGVMILLRSYLCGARVLLGSTETATHLSLVATQLRRSLPPPSTKVLLGGGPIPFSLCQKAAAHGISLFTSYGMTEMAAQITTHHFFLSDTELTLGHPLPGRELKIENGEVFVRGKTLFAGYVGEEPPRDWFATKDLGFYDEKGLRILGRKDRMFISGGENIYPEEIEKALLKHPLIDAALVKGTEDPEWGKKTIAYIASKTPLAKEELKEFLLSFLPPYKIPKEFNFSLTSAGKGMVSLD